MPGGRGLELAQLLREHGSEIPNRGIGGRLQLIDGRYELLEVIASGGMATVWRARDTRLERMVALKRAHPSPPGGDSTERMTREARAAAGLRHPGLVTVYDFGTDADGPFLVMELVEGPTLQETIGNVGLGEAVQVGVQLAEALAAIHEAGIVHRDVKPANVIMSANGPLLTDFGIALDPTTTQEITAPGQVVATPMYAAPEVLAGERPTPASDVYSLGFLIDRLIGERGSKPDRGLEGVLSAAMAESPADRPSASAFAERLRAAAPTMTAYPAGGDTLVLEPLTTAPDPSTPGRPRRAGPLWFAFGSLVLLVGGLAAVVIAFSVDDPSPEAATSTTASTTTTTTSTPTTVLTTVAAAPVLTVEESRDSLESILNETPRSQLKKRDLDEIVKKVDEAIEAVDEGDLEKAEKKISEAAKRIEDELDPESQDEVLAALEGLAELLGVEFDR